MTFVIGNFISTLFRLIELAILIECIGSWVFQGKQNEFLKIISNFTYPVLEPFRKIQNKFIPNMMIDVSPILAIFALDIIKAMVLTILY